MTTEREAYCLFCRKLGHRSHECHSTHGLNTPEAREISRLVREANPEDHSSDRNDAAGARKLVAWACFNSAGLIDHELVGTKEDCEYWRDAQDAQDKYTVVALYAAMDEPASRSGYDPTSIDRSDLS